MAMQGGVIYRVDVKGTRKVISWLRIARLKGEAWQRRLLGLPRSALPGR